MTGSLRIGTSGWVYRHWTNDAFYPSKLPGNEQLPFFARHFDTVEINYSFYQLPSRTRFEAWKGQVPAGFLFAAKASRYLTHMKKLNEPEEPLRRLMEAVSGLDDRLGPILFQFPKWWRLNRPRLEAFLEALQSYPGHRWAFELRHQSWLVPEVYALLDRHGAALCLPVGWDLPLDIRLTTSWTYVRFHGGQHAVGFADAELEPWAERFRQWRDQGTDVYAYFNNDPPSRYGDVDLPGALHDARRLRQMLGEHVSWDLPGAVGASLTGAV